MSRESPRWIDFHCHLDLYPDHEQLVSQCDSLRIATLAVTTTPKSFERNWEIAADSAHVVVALGLHPQLVGRRGDEISLFERLLERTRYVGEIGLDASPQHYAGFKLQEQVFCRCLQTCDEQGLKILSIHSVRSTSRVLKHIETSLRSGTCVPVLHWFTGTASEVRRAVALGCFFSVNSEMLGNEKGRTIVLSLPIDRILTETDGPFVQVGGRPAKPADVPATVAQLAGLLRIEPDRLAHQLLSNLSALHNGPPKAALGLTQRDLF